MTIGQHYYWKGMRHTIVDSFKRCDICQRTKHFPDKFGKLPVKHGELIPWHTLCIDLIGPYKLGQDEFAYKSGVKVKTFDAPILQCMMTMIDPATGWFEIEEVATKRADVITNVLETTWLTRYPLPTEVVADRGTEFMGECLLMVCEEYGLPRKLITARNPQANTIIERCHQTLHNLLVRTYQLHTKVKDGTKPTTTLLPASLTQYVEQSTVLYTRPCRLRLCNWSLDATRSSQSAFKPTGII